MNVYMLGELIVRWVQLNHRDAVVMCIGHVTTDDELDSDNNNNNNDHYNSH